MNAGRASAFAQVEEMLTLGAEGMFACYGASCTAHKNQPAPESSEAMIVATIGWAAGDGSRGSLLVVTTRSVLEYLQPPEGYSMSNPELCDAVGEYANMLLGRLKNMLLGHGVTLMLGTPTTAIVERPWLATPLGRWSWMAFEIGSGVAYVRLDAALTDEFVLSEESSALTPELAEGEMMLF